MLLLARSGQRSAALAQYGTCRKLLGEELGVEPGEQTTRLYEQIRDGELEIPLVVPVVIAPPEPVPRRPRFLEVDEAEVEPPVLVARERELARLDGTLGQALEGHGQMLFVTGGPGRGKTALLGEFARRAMGAHPNLLVARGRCNAYAGVGDPYLPFREVLGMLTGDAEALWAAGAVTREHALRLWGALPVVVQAMLERGPDLLPVLVPGEDLLSRALAAAPGAPWLPLLRDRVRGEHGVAEDLEQSHLFQQVTEVLCDLARTHPRLLILDDLQWMDSASAGLLFHVGRRLGGVASCWRAPTGRRRWRSAGTESVTSGCQNGIRWRRFWRNLR